MLLSIFISLLIALFAFDRSGNAHFAMARQLARFAPAPELPSIMKAEMILTAVFFLYLPFTHMTHFVGKFFTYHKVRWEDHPNIRGSKIEKAVAEYLGYKLSWSAPHIKAGTSWAEAVSGDSNDSEKGKKS